MWRFVSAVFLCLAGLVSTAASQEVTLEQVMAHPDWLGRQPENPYWAADGSAVYYERKVDGSEERRLYRHPLGDGSGSRASELVAIGDVGNAHHPGGDFSSDGRRQVYAREGDLFVRDVVTGKLVQLTRTAAEESEPRFMADESRARFYRDDTVFVRELETGLEYQPAVLRFEKDPDEEPTDASYWREQQRRLIDHVREREEKEDAARERDEKARAADGTRVPAPFYLGEEMELEGVSLSPSGRHLVVLMLPKDRNDGKNDRMPDYITEDAFAEAREVRDLVGTREPVSDTVVLIDLLARKTTTLSFDDLPGIQEDPLAHLREEPIEGARPVYVGTSGFGSSGTDGVLWSDDGGALVLHVFSWDNKDRWLAEVDLESGAIASIHRDTDEAWINWRLNVAAFLKDSRTLYLTSEASGYSQLYTLSLETKEKKRLSEGDFVVSDVTPSLDGRYLYYTANVEHPGNYETSRYDLREGRNEQVTSLGGTNAYVLSPDGSKLLIEHSVTTAPPDLYVQDARPGAEVRRITDTVSDRFESFPWVAPEIVAVPSTHHARPIYSRVYTPPGPAPALPRPAVVFVHGAGYLQNAHQGWSSYFREFMFHTLLTQKGYVVLDMDYRASAGYGRDWRTAIYRQMGTPELEDLKDGVRYLVESRGVDPARVGVYGGSYGGFMTLMSLFREPDLFACGAALRPVTDWAHYNHPYTSRILNTPSVDPEAYERSSPIEYADGLRKPLLMAHGMVDDNVFFKDSVRLAQVLIELEKEDWELAVYPVEPHGFREPSSWLDEYRRILKLFETHLGTVP